jgi:hypothetical protein
MKKAVIMMVVYAMIIGGLSFGVYAGLNAFSDKIESGESSFMKDIADKIESMRLKKKDL